MWAERSFYYQSTNYRELVAQWVEYQKKKNKYFSFRMISKKGGFRSPNYFQLILSGQRNIGFEGFIKLSNLMQLKSLERDYFHELIQFNQATTPEEKQQKLENLIQIRNRAAQKHSFRVPIADYEYLSNWLYVALREWIATHPQINSAKEMAEAFRFSIQQEDVHHALAFLLKNGLIEKRGNDFFVCEMNLVSTDEVRSLAIQKFHKQILELAGKSLEQDDLQTREFGALTLSLTPPQIQDLKNRLKKFRSELHEIYAQPLPNSQVVQVSFYAFPLTREKTNPGENS